MKNWEIAQLAGDLISSTKQWGLHMENWARALSAIELNNAHSYVFFFLVAFFFAIIFDWVLKGKVQVSYKAATGKFESEYKFPSGVRIILILSYVLIATYCYLNVDNIYDIRNIMALLFFLLYLAHSIHYFISIMHDK